MNTDNLDSLSDSALSETFAVEVAGWRLLIPKKGNVAALWENAAGETRERDGFGTYCISPDHFATSADAVLPWLVAEGWTCDNSEKTEPCKVRVWPEGRWHIPIIGTAPTFARAACIALIRSKRAEKGQP
jgi:hypothetical protein